MIDQNEWSGSYGFRGLFGIAMHPQLWAKMAKQLVQSMQGDTRNLGGWKVIYFELGMTEDGKPQVLNAWSPKSQVKAWILSIWYRKTLQIGHIKLKKAPLELLSAAWCFWELWYVYIYIYVYRNMVYHISQPRHQPKSLIPFSESVQSAKPPQLLFDMQIHGRFASM